MTSKENLIEVIIPLLVLRNYASKPWNCPMQHAHLKEFSSRPWNIILFYSCLQLFCIFCYSYHFINLIFNVSCLVLITGANYIENKNITKIKLPVTWYVKVWNKFLTFVKSCNCYEPKFDPRKHVCPTYWHLYISNQC